MEKKILQVIHGTEFSGNSQRGRRESPSPLGIISMNARNRYLGYADRIRRASMAGLSPTPYNAWGIDK